MIKRIQSILESIWKFNPEYEIEEVKESNNNQVFFHNTIVCKISKNPNNLKLEYDVLKRIEGSWLFSKAIHYCELDNLFFLFMERLEWKGIEYERDMLTLIQKKEIIKQIVVNMKAIHTHATIHPLPYIHYCKEKFASYYEIAKNNPNIIPIDLSNIYERFLSKTGLIEKKLHDVLVHHDLWYKNILVNKWKLTWIIDFETAIYAPREVELFRLFHHKDCAQSYIDSGSEEYTEVEYLDMLLEEIKEQYPELYQFDKNLFDCYNLQSYIQKLSRYTEKWYDHSEVMWFYNTFCK